jgi:micrococcal nuclease
VRNSVATARASDTGLRRVRHVRHPPAANLIGVLAALLLTLSPSAAAQGPAPAAAATLRVRQVIDGDTITVSGVGTVRLLGVDAPEKTGSYRQSEPYGDAATKFMKTLLDGKLVRLDYDGERKDQYNRTLAYVYLEDGTLANEAIIRAGYAETYRRFTYRLKPRFQAAEQEARAAHRGMWAGRR